VGALKVPPTPNELPTQPSTQFIGGRDSITNETSQPAPPLRSPTPPSTRPRASRSLSTKHSLCLPRVSVRSPQGFPQAQRSANCRASPAQVATLPLSPPQPALRVPSRHFNPSHHPRRHTTLSQVAHVHPTFPLARTGSCYPTRQHLCLLVAETTPRQMAHSEITNCQSELKMPLSTTYGESRSGEKCPNPTPFENTTPKSLRVSYLFYPLSSGFIPVSYAYLGFYTVAFLDTI